MYSFGQRFVLSIVVALLLAFTPSTVSAAVPFSPPQQQEPEKTPVPVATIGGVVIVTPAAPGDPEPEPPDPEETPVPTPVESTPDATAEPTAEPSLEATATPRPAPPEGEANRYRVERGDTLYSIARNHGITVADLQEANGLAGTAIQAGQILVIPTGSRSGAPTATPTLAAQATVTPTLAVPTATALPSDRPTTPTEPPPPSEGPGPESSDFITKVEEYTEQLLRWIAPLASGASPFVFVGALVGVVNSCLFYLVLGRSLKLFIPFVLLGAAAAVIGVTVSMQLPESGPVIGEVDLIAASVATWLTLLIARSFRL